METIVTPSTSSPDPSGPGEQHRAAGTGRTQRRAQLTVLARLVTLLAAVLLVNAVLLAVVLVSPVAADPLGPSATAAGGTACPATIADDEFDDVREWTTHEHAIDCLAWWGISIGDTSGRYQPQQPVTRGQIATFLDRTLTVAGSPLPATSTPVYTDIPAGHTHADAIHRLGTAGILRPATGTRYQPTAALTRDDMAVFLVAAWQHITGQELPTPTRTFVDLAGHPDRTVIETAAALGFTNGTTADTYAPDGAVTRDRMASFLTRLLDDLTTNHDLPTPTAPAWGDLPPGRAPYLPLPTAPSSGYQLTISPFDLPSRWNPCLPVEVAVDLTGAPDGAADATRTAIDRLRDATGLHLIYRERTGHQPDHVWESMDWLPLHRPGRIQVSWPRQWSMPGSIAGMGGHLDHQGWIIAGMVVLKPDLHLSQDDLTVLLMHELGHAIGLGHPDDQDNLMASGRYDLGPHLRPGDLAGFARVGRGMGCPPQPFLTWAEADVWGLLP
ncbi:MAG: S-layer homology domain-containing protein [Nitriliruptoraceae bacterium]